jgi:hypothetical protein
MEKHYFKMTKISKKEILSHPDQDILGHREDVDTSILPNSLWFDSEPVAIKDVIETLIEMNSKGANYVCIDWHCDHRELEIVGLEFRLATPEEAEEYRKIMDEKEKNRKESEILRLEERLQKLKEEK